MRFHLVAAAIVTVGAVYLRLTRAEWATLVFAIALVLVTEMLNTAVEATVDLCTGNFHPLAKIAKDVAAGAVLLAAFCSVIIGVLVFGPHLGIFFH